MSANFSDRIKELRTSLDLKQSEFSEVINITQAAMSAYEKGDRFPTMDTLIAISNSFNVSIDWLCGLSDIKSLPNKINTYSDFFMFLTYLCDIRYLDDSDENLREHPVVALRQNGISTSFQCREDRNINAFFEQWYKIHELYLAKTIDEDIYNIWLEKELEKYDFPINGLPGFMS